MNPGWNNTWGLNSGVLARVHAPAGRWRDGEVAAQQGSPVNAAREVAVMLGLTPDTPWSVTGSVLQRLLSESGMRVGAQRRSVVACGTVKRDSLARRISDAVHAEVGDALTDIQTQHLVEGVVSEIRPELDKLREANKERGRISTRLYLARLELREITLRMRRLQRNTGYGSQHAQRMLRLLRDLMHAVDPALVDGPLGEDLDHCLWLAQKHRHEAISTRLDPRDAV